MMANKAKLSLTQFNLHNQEFSNDSPKKLKSVTKKYLI